MQAPVHRESDVLDLWERAVGLDRWRREDALLGQASPTRGLGARNIALLHVRNAHFRGVWPMQSACPRCGSFVEFSADCEALASGLSVSDQATSNSLQWRGAAVVARAPTVDDLRAAAMAIEPRAVARALLARCVSDIDLSGDDDDAVEELGAQLEALDPAATILFDLACPDCAHEWSAPLDVGEALWSEVRVAAERLLLQVDALARAYGWSEGEVLALSPTRRAAYLQLAEEP